MTSLASPGQISNRIQELMAVTQKPREFKTFKKFRQHRDAQVKELFFALRTIIFPPGLKLKRANGRTYEVQSDGSFRRLPEVFEKPWQPKN